MRCRLFARVVAPSRAAPNAKRSDASANVGHYFILSCATLSAIFPRLWRFMKVIDTNWWRIIKHSEWARECLSELACTHPSRYEHLLGT